LPAIALITRRIVQSGIWYFDYPWAIINNSGDQDDDSSSVTFPFQKSQMRQAAISTAAAAPIAVPELYFHTAIYVKQMILLVEKNGNFSSPSFYE
jgi:hypothetical protein